MSSATISFTDQRFTTYCKEGYKHLEPADRAMRLFGSDGLCGILRQSSIIAGTENPSAMRVGDTVTAMRTGISLCKSGLKMIHVFSGRMFEDWKDKDTTWTDIAGDISIVVARAFNPVVCGHRMKLYDLGRNAGWMGTVVSCAFTACNAF